MKQNNLKKYYNERIRSNENYPEFDMLTEEHKEMLSETLGYVMFTWDIRWTEFKAAIKKTLKFKFEAIPGTGGHIMPTHPPSIPPSILPFNAEDRKKWIDSLRSRGLELYYGSRGDYPISISYTGEYHKQLFTEAERQELQFITWKEWGGGKMNEDIEFRFEEKKKEFQWPTKVKVIKAENNRHVSLIGKEFRLRLGKISQEFPSWVLNGQIKHPDVTFFYYNDEQHAILEAPHVEKLLNNKNLEPI